MANDKKGSRRRHDTAFENMASCGNDMRRRLLPHVMVHEDFWTKLETPSSAHSLHFVGNVAFGYLRQKETLIQLRQWKIYCRRSVSFFTLANVVWNSRLPIAMSETHNISGPGNC